jgi:hypothetical protein
MTSLNTILTWFTKGKYPTEAQFSETWNSFWHKQTPIPVGNVEGLNQILVAKADTTVMNNTITERCGNGGLIEITEGYIDVVFETPYPVDVPWRFLSKPYCYNEAGENVDYVISNITQEGFRVTPSDVCTFIYQHVKR